MWSTGYYIVVDWMGRLNFYGGYITRLWWTACILWKKGCKIMVNRLKNCGGQVLRLWWIGYKMMVSRLWDYGRKMIILSWASYKIVMDSLRYFGGKCIFLRVLSIYDGYNYFRCWLTIYQYLHIWQFSENSYSECGWQVWGRKT